MRRWKITGTGDPAFWDLWPILGHEKTAHLLYLDVIVVVHLFQPCTAALCCRYFPL